MTTEWRRHDCQLGEMMPRRSGRGSKGHVFRTGITDDVVPSLGYEAYGPTVTGNARQTRTAQPAQQASAAIGAGQSQPGAASAPCEQLADGSSIAGVRGKEYQRFLQRPSMNGRQSSGGPIQSLAIIGRHLARRLALADPASPVEDIPARWVADLICYWCGEILHACPIDGPATVRLVVDPTVRRKLTWRGGRPRCAACSGPVYLDDPRKHPDWDPESFAPRLLPKASDAQPGPRPGAAC